MLCLCEALAGHEFFVLTKIVSDRTQQSNDSIFSICRAFYLALYKHMMFLEKRGCPRTALEYCKLILR